MPTRAILFDKDGTLIDFEKTWWPALQAASNALGDWTDDGDLPARLLEAAGYDPVRERVRGGTLLAGGSNEELAQLWSRLSSLPDPGDVARRIVQMLEYHAASEAVPLFDVPALFAALAERDIVVGVATMDAEWVARRTLESLSLSDEVAFVCGYDSGFGEKPEPGMVHAFCHAISMPPDMVMVVGDGPHDLKMARNAGSKAVGVRSGVSEEAEIAAFADHVIDDARQVLDLL